MDLVSVVVYGVIAVVVVWAVAIFNGLVRRRQAVRNSWSQITVQLKRRHELIPNLVETVRGSMKFERETLEAVMKARNAAAAADDPRSAIAAEGALGGALARFYSVTEAYPEIKATGQAGSLMEDLRATENLIAFARQAYNDAVESLNVKIESFPDLLIAGPFGFKQEPMFEVGAEEAARIATPPKVQL
jgi:LemA protein